MEKKFRNGSYLFCGILLCIFLFFSAGIKVNAVSGGPSPHSDSTHEESSSGPSAHSNSSHDSVHTNFDYLSNGNSASKAEKTVLGVGATVYQMLLKTGIFGVVIALILCGISFLIKGDDSRERAELKTWLLRIGIVLIIMTSLTSIAGLFGGLFTGVFS